MSRRTTLTVRIIAIAAIVAALWWFFQKLDVGKLGDALGNAKIWPLILAAALNFGCLWGKALCWHIMLLPRFVVRVRRLFRYTIATFAASAIAPARAGEVLRIWILKRRENVPASDTAAVAVAEKLLDGISMLLLVAPVPFLLSGLPAWVVGSIALCAGIAVGSFIGLYIAAGRVGPAGTGRRAWLRRFFAGMHVLRSPKRLFASLGVLVFVWLLDLGEVMLVLYAVGISLPISAGLLILFTLNLAITLPSTPAQVGALEVGALAALEILHVPSHDALAFALLYHALQVLPLIIAGLALELRLVLGREPALKRGVADAIAEEREVCPKASQNDNAPELPSARTVLR